MPSKKSKKPKKRKTVSGQRAADRIANKSFFGFRMSEREQGVNTKTSLDKSRKELSLGLKPSSRFKGGLSRWERGLTQKIRKGKKI